MPTAKKKPTKKTTKKPARQRSLARSRETVPFMTFRVTHETLYWLIIGLLVLAIGVWVMYLSARVNHLYDNIQLRAAENHMMYDKQMMRRD